MRTKSLALALLLGAILLPGFAAGGAGGVFFSVAEPTWNPTFLPQPPDSLPDLEFVGGSGYGVTADGVIVGGFGLALLDYYIADGSSWSSLDSLGNTVPMHTAGGAGGLLIGSRLLSSKSAHLDLCARLGMGGLAVWTRERWDSTTDSSFGYWYSVRGLAVLYVEPYVELGLGLTRWMSLSARLGYPIIGNFIPGKPFSDLIHVSPTIGFAIDFGRFR